MEYTENSEVSFPNLVDGILYKTFLTCFSLKIFRYLVGFEEFLSKFRIALLGGKERKIIKHLSSRCIPEYIQSAEIFQSNTSNFIVKNTFKATCLAL